MATTFTTELQKLYVAYFNRPADPAGLAFWNTVVTNAGGSTAAVSAEFAKSAEYKAIYSGMTNTQIINQVYTNLFGHAPDPEGRTYWVKALDDKIFTIDKIVAEVANGAQGTDKTAFTNKTTAATAFTTAVDTDAEIAAYTGTAANLAAKAFIAGITTDASLQTALTPAALDATVASVVKAGTAFTLAGGLADLLAANEAKAAFLVTADGDDDADTSATKVSLDAEVTAAQVDVGALVTGYAAATSATVKAALLTDKQAALDEALVDVQKDYTDAVKAAAEVDGLAAAVASQAAAVADVDSAADVQLNATAALAAATASYNALQAVDAPAAGSDGTYAGLIELKNGALVLVSGITETTNKGVTALLNASKALEAAQLSHTTAVAAQAAADLEVNVLDLGAGEVTALGNIGAGFTVTDPDDAAKPTAIEIQTEITGLTSVATSARAAADATPADAALETAADNAEAALATFEGLVATFVAIGENDLSDAITAAEAAVKTATDNIVELDEAVVALTAAQANVTKLATLEAAIDASEAAFVTANFKAPVTLDAAFAGATSGSDIFMVGSAETASISNFGLQGDDVLYIGSDYTLNTGALSTGNNAVLEVFLIQSGANTVVTLETKAFGSSSADAEIKITLTGVDVNDVTLANGIITVA
jgi:hypothetical protein